MLDFGNYFTLKEFECKCGCGQCDMSQALIYRLNLARHMAKVPFVITSGFRCKQHNENVGGVKNSAHTKGLAVDIKVDNGNRIDIITALDKHGFTAIGIYDNFVHAGTDCKFHFILPPVSLFTFHFSNPQTSI